MKCKHLRGDYIILVLDENTQTWHLPCTNVALLNFGLLAAIDFPLAWAWHFAPASSGITDTK